MPIIIVLVLLSVGWMVAEFRAKRALRIILGICTLIAAVTLVWANGILGVRYANLETRKCIVAVRTALGKNYVEEVKKCLDTYSESTSAGHTEYSAAAYKLMDDLKGLPVSAEQESAPPK